MNSVHDHCGVSGVCGCVCVCECECVGCECGGCEGGVCECGVCGCEGVCNGMKCMCVCVMV